MRLRTRQEWRVKKEANHEPPDRSSRVTRQQNSTTHLFTGFLCNPLCVPQNDFPNFRRRQTHTDTLTDTLSVRASVTPFPFKTRLGGALLLRLGDTTLLETVLEPPGQGLDVPAAASAGSPTALSLGGPVVCASAHRQLTDTDLLAGTCEHIARCVLLSGVSYGTKRCMYLRVVCRDYKLHLHNKLAGTNMTP